MTCWADLRGWNIGSSSEQSNHSPSLVSNCHGYGCAVSSWRRSLSSSTAVRSLSGTSLIVTMPPVGHVL